MQKILCLLLLATAPQAASEDELLFARRIIECWRDHDVDLAKGQIQLFLEKHPKSAFKDHFQAILGDIALERLDYQNALASYDQIRSQELAKQVRTKRWHTLYQLKMYPELYQEISPLLSFIKEEEALFYFAEAAFREALALDAIEEAADQRRSLFEEALPIYKKLQYHEEFSDHVMLATAEIYRRIGQYENAAALFLKIANEKKSHQTLFHAATMLIQCDPDQACDLFAQIAKGGGKKSAEAAYQWIQLLAKHKDWETLTRERRCFLSTLSDKHLPVYHFYSGMVHYDREEWESAVGALEMSLKGGLKPPHDRGALLSLMLAAKECPSLDAADFAYYMLKERYPNEIEEAAFYRAITYRRAGQGRIALSFLSELIAMGEKAHILEDACIEKMHLLMEQKQWVKSHDLALKFLGDFPDSRRRSEVLRLVVDLSLAALDQGGGYQRLESDLERALDSYAVFDAGEKLDKQILLAKCYLKLEKPTSAHTLLEEILQTAPESAEGHYLMTVALIKLGNQPSELIDHAEAVLTYDPLFPESDRVHLYLFNAYLELSKEDANEACAHKAAAHLYEVIDTIPVSLENQLWLAHTYAREKVHHPRALKILEGILIDDAKIERFTDEAIILATLYEECKNFSSAFALFEKVHQLRPLPYVSYKLGSVLAHLGEYEKSHTVLNKLEDVSDLSVSLPAALINARVCDKLGVNREEVLRKLKGLWVRKRLMHEPVHLEAALDFADLSPQENLLEILEEIKEHFISESDILSKDYHEQRLACPEKDLIFQAYMRYLDARIGLAQAEADQYRGIDGRAKRRSAMALMRTLTEGEFAVTDYLVEKASERTH